MKKILLTLAAATLIVAPTLAHAGLLEDWTGDVFVGYNQTSGNTDKGSGRLQASTTKGWDDSTFTLKGSLSYSQSNNKMDSQKWDALAKYTQAFGDDKEWFRLAQILADHDRFSNIDYRITPSVGIGYHFARTESWTWNADVSLGYSTTELRVPDPTVEDGFASLIAHTFMKKQVFDNAFLSEDFTIIPGLKSGAGFRAKSETTFANPLSANMDLEIKYIVDYDSEPSAGKSSTDKQIVAGLKYKF